MIMDGDEINSNNIPYNNKFNYCRKERFTIILPGMQQKPVSRLHNSKVKNMKRGRLLGNVFESTIILSAFSGEQL